MNPKDKASLFKSFSDPAGKSRMEFTVERNSVEDGKSFSKEAMDELMDQVFLFIGARIVARWDKTKEPPTIVKVEVKVSVG